MRPELPKDFLTVPIAHRALHDVSDNRPENSRAAIQAAIDAGYGIEIDLQLSEDHEALVFHDYGLARLTDQSGPIGQLSAKQAAQVPLKYGTNQTIPNLKEVLEMVNGRVPILIEIKDQDGAMGPNVGPLEQATTAALRGYSGAAAVMSFNPFSIKRMAELAPDLPRGLVTCEFDPADWPFSSDRCEALRDIPDFESSGACFVSHSKTDLTRKRLSELRNAGVPILCWTIRSPEEEAQAREHADNVTFEGYAAVHPG